MKMLMAHGFEVALVVAQPFKKLKVPKSKFQISPKLPVYGDLEMICEKNRITYLAADHDSYESVAAIGRHKCDLGLILGARILKPNTIKKFEYGILNIHPGAIPENRGLDNFKWAIINKLKMANTAHLIDEKIDMGRIIKIKETNYHDDDTIHDFYLRHFFSEFTLMLESLGMIIGGDADPTNVSNEGVYFSAVPDEEDKEFQLHFEQYKKFRK